MHEVELYKEMYYPGPDLRSEGVGIYLGRKYGVVPNNTWINLYARDLKLTIGGFTMTPQVGTEIAFYSPAGPQCLGAGLIESKPGMMKFTPIYTHNQYGHGLKPGEGLIAYVFGFPFDLVPTVNYLGGYQQFEISGLNLA